MTDISRRQFLTAASLAAGAASMPRILRAQDTFIGASRRGADDFVVVETAFGKVRGTRDAGLSVFKGIPYAGSVSGDHRFRRPAPLEAWTGVRDALRLGAPSIQPDRRATADEPAPAEDCLALNVWTPAADQRRRPVMFYSHGGGYVSMSTRSWIGQRYTTSAATRGKR